MGIAGDRGVEVDVEAGGKGVVDDGVGHGGLLTGDELIAAEGEAAAVVGEGGRGKSNKGYKNAKQRFHGLFSG